jgi:hypothetical protein
MRRHFAAPTPRFGRVNNRLPMGHQQRSPYYWWWQYLRRNADYLACCERGGTGDLAELYADFGDVREDNFHKWWTEAGRGVRLFAEQPLSVNFVELESAAEWQTNWSKDTVMVLAVPLAVSKRRLKGVFAKLLDIRHTGHKSGRPSMAKLKDVSTARYKLEKNYTISNLMMALAVYDLWTENQSKAKDQRLTLWEIGKAMNINRAAIKDAESSSPADRLAGRNVLAATVSRYVKQARAMIANTVYARFPSTAPIGTANKEQR